MVFLRRYVLIAMGRNDVVAFFNTLSDAKEHATRLRNIYPTMYDSIKIFQETTQ